MNIDAVEFLDDNIGHVNSKPRPDLVQVGTKLATLRYRDFVTGQPRADKIVVYIKCRPDMVDGFTPRRIDYALERLRRVFLTGKLSYGSKVMAITDPAFFDKESE